MDYVRIVSPLTGEYVRVYSDAIEALLKMGYTEKDIQESGRLDPQYNRYSVFTNDILFHIMLHTDMQTTLSLGLVDRQSIVLIADQYLWKLKLIQDGLEYVRFRDMIYSLTTYRKIMIAVNDAIDVMKRYKYTCITNKRDISLLNPKFINRYQVDTQSDIMMIRLNTNESMVELRVGGKKSYIPKERVRIMIIQDLCNMYYYCW